VNFLKLNLGVDEDGIEISKKRDSQNHGSQNSTNLFNRGQLVIPIIFLFRDIK
jgi:hypothetical protein